MEAHSSDSRRTTQAWEKVSSQHENFIPIIEDFNQTTDWFHAQRSLRQEVLNPIRSQCFSITTNRELGQHFTKMRLRDIISFALTWKKGQFDDNLLWQCEVVRYLHGFLIQEEEDWLVREVQNFTRMMRDNRSDVVGYSKALAAILRHTTKYRHFCNPRGAMEINALFDVCHHRLSGTRQMSGAQFAAFILSNPKSRYRIDVEVGDWWTTKGTTYHPIVLRVAAVQGHSNRVVDPMQVHHVLTVDEAKSLGWIFHVTDTSKCRRDQPEWSQATR